MAEGSKSSGTPVSFQSLQNGTTVIVPAMQSVIQSAHQSVIQTVSSSAVPTTLRTNGDIILVKHESVIQSPSSSSHHQASQHQRSDMEDNGNCSTEEELLRKRREALIRRPSYRKILDDIAGTEKECQAKVESSSSDCESNMESTDLSVHTVPVSAGHYHTVLPAGTLQFSSHSDSLQGLSTISVPSAGGGTILHYTPIEEGQFFVPTEIVTGPPSSSSTEHTESNSLPEEQLRKREMRLLKNREAARECRRKKKEYIKCLETRVAVLETQNKALIEELKSLKELYCQRNDMD